MGLSIICHFKKQTGEDHHLNIGEGIIIVDKIQSEIIFKTGGNEFKNITYR